MHEEVGDDPDDGEGHGQDHKRPSDLWPVIHDPDADGGCWRSSSSLPPAACGPLGIAAEVAAANFFFTLTEGVVVMEVTGGCCTMAYGG